MKNTFKTAMAGTAFTALLAINTVAFAAEPIVGSWRTQSGETAAITKCGGSFCVTLRTGEHAGKRIGRMSGQGGSYKGKITDPSNDKTYAGTAKVSGSSMKMTGCALKVFCRTQNWKRK